jgi:endonuclease YncB( thermonuclease family)
VVDGQLVRLAGVDTPELGPWAKCWAEAAMGGHARDEVARQLASRFQGRPWKLAVVGRDGEGRALATFTRNDGEDLADVLVVDGYAARTTGRWDWCGTNANLHDTLEGEPAPHGPTLWWPSGQVYDPRAGD